MIKKQIICTLFFLSFLLGGYAATPDKNWNTYSNSACGYKITYPQNSKLTEGPDALKGFYLDPIAFIHNLKNNELFNNMTIENQCIAKISLPITPHTDLDGKYLIILKINNIPDQWPPPLSSNTEKLVHVSTVKIGDKEYYKGASYQAGMCHSYDYYYNFTKKNNQYYVLLFLFTSHCFGTVDTDKSRFNLKVESKDFERIISSFELR